MSHHLRHLFAKTWSQTLAAALLGAAAFSAQAANVLVVLSDESALALRDQQAFQTGFYANELMQPVKMLIDAGHTITFATPFGKAPTVDRLSLDKAYFGGDAAAMQSHLDLLERLRLTSASASPVISLARVEQIGYDKFDALYVPGGHAPMQDLVRSPALGKLLRQFHADGKPTALVCHGPAALASATDQPQAYAQALEAGSLKGQRPAWIYAGYKMTVISNMEEDAAKAMLKGGSMKFLPQTALEGLGANYSSGPNWAPYIVADRELITGQNPASATGVASALLQRLSKAP